MTEAAASPNPASRSVPVPDARLRILDAAEREFADRGVHGAALRRIGEAAGVAPALINYHFGGREALFEAVIRRRVEAINAARMRMLDSMPDPGLEEVLYALFRPALDRAAGGEVFGRILAGAAYGPRDRQLMIERHFDAVARRFVAAFRRALPGLTQERAARGHFLCIGAMISVMASAGRPERLLGESEDQALAEGLGAAIQYAAGGLRALAQSGVED